MLQSEPRLLQGRLHDQYRRLLRLSSEDFFLQLYSRRVSVAASLMSLSPFAISNMDLKMPKPITSSVAIPFPLSLPERKRNPFCAFDTACALAA